MEIWKGKLTTANLEIVVTLLRQMLTGKSYLIREIRFNGILKPAETKEVRLTPFPGNFVAELYNNSSGAGFMVHNDLYSWGHAIAPDSSDTAVLNPYFIFTEDSIIIQSRNCVTIIYDIRNSS